MSEETASRAIDFALSDPSPYMKFEFQGSRSLLNFDLIKYIVEETHEKNKIFRKNLSFAIATNLAVVTDEMLDFAKFIRLIFRLLWMAHQMFMTTIVQGQAKQS